MRKKWSSLLLFCCLYFCCTAQTAGYKFYAPLDSVKTPGFYNIEITPELSAYLKTDYSDLRIVNDSGKWVPHVLHYANEEHDSLVYKSLRITKKEIEATNTILEIAADNEIIANLVLRITNTTAERFATVSGSNDGKSWFVINDSILINPKPDPSGISNIFSILFPPNNYKFFKIVIFNKKKDPFDIKEVLQFFITSVDDNLPAKLILNPATVIEQKDSGKISYIKIIQNKPYHFDNISLTLTNAKYFSRKVDLYIPSSSKNSFSNPGELIQSLTISNNSILNFNLSHTYNPTVFYLLINNEDNLPLKLTGIKTTFKYRYITSYLENGNPYRLIMGNSVAVMPDYDLNSTTPYSTPYLSFGKIIPFEQKEITESPKKNNNWILWTAIIAALFILLLFTKKMMSELNKRKQDDSL